MKKKTTGEEGHPEQPGTAEQAQPAQEQQAPEKEAAEQENYYDQLLRLKADFENYRKRVEKEKPELIAFGKAQAICRLLPIYDSVLHAKTQLETALASGDGTGSAQLKDLAKGLEMIYGEFSKVFESEGITCMDTVGKTYDPMNHEVLGVVDGDESNDGKVVDELQRGFLAGGKLLRPARVRIARKKEASPKQEG